MAFCKYYKIYSLNPFSLGYTRIIFVCENRNGIIISEKEETRSVGMIVLIILIYTLDNFVFKKKKSVIFESFYNIFTLLVTKIFEF